MKAALITEEQIKAIEAALVELQYSNSTLVSDLKYETALAILKSLKVQEPSMVSSTSNKSFAMYTIEIPFVGEQP